MQFSVSDEEHKQIEEWLITTVYPEIIKKQKETMTNPSPFVIEIWNQGFPSEGAIGGGVTYTFTPTSLGVVFKVIYGSFELDLTKYDEW